MARIEELQSCSTPKSLRKKFKKYKIIYLKYFYENNFKKIFYSEKNLKNFLLSKIFEKCSQYKHLQLLKSISYVNISVQHLFYMIGNSVRAAKV